VQAGPGRAADAQQAALDVVCASWKEARAPAVHRGFAQGFPRSSRCCWGCVCCCGGRSPVHLWLHVRSWLRLRLLRELWLWSLVIFVLLVGALMLLLLLVAVMLAGQVVVLLLLLVLLLGSSSRLLLACLVLGGAALRLFLLQKHHKKGKQAPVLQNAPCRRMTDGYWTWCPPRCTKGPPLAAGGALLLLRHPACTEGPGGSPVPCRPPSATGGFPWEASQQEPQQRKLLPLQESQKESQHWKRFSWEESQQESQQRERPHSCPGCPRGVSG